MKLSNAARQGATVGEIVNLMSVDSQKLQDAPGYLHMLWSAPLTIALAMYFLWQQLGPATLAGIALVYYMCAYCINAFLVHASVAEKCTCAMKHVYTCAQTHMNIHKAPVSKVNLSAFVYRIVL